jgi:hypothetical protein
MRNFVWMILFVLAFGFVAGWTILGALGAAVAQSITPTQQQAIRDLAYVVAANEECDFTADESAINVYLKGEGLDLGIIGGDPTFADRIDAAMVEARGAAQKDKATFCARTWEMFGKDGGKIRSPAGDLTRSSPANPRAVQASPLSRPRRVAIRTSERPSLNWLGLPHWGVDGKQRWPPYCSEPLRLYRLR